MKARQLEIVSVVESCVAFLVGAVLAARKRSGTAFQLAAHPGANLEGGLVTKPAVGSDRTKETLFQVSPS